jgi:transposase-like protein
LAQFASRRLSEAFPYLILDARYAIPCQELT